MKEITQDVEALLHDLAHRVAAMKAAIATRSGVDAWDHWSTETKRSIHQTFVARSDLDEATLRATLDVTAREIDLFEATIQNFLGSMGLISYEEPPMQNFKLSTLVFEVLELFEGLASDKGVELTISIRDEPELFRGNALLIKRALVNVIDNAVKYSFSSSTHSARRVVQCTIRRHSTQNHILFRVESYGLGVLADEIQAIFEYGQRGRLASDRARQGTGIGLPEARKIVEAHGGTIQLASAKVNEGAYLTKVSLILPGVG